jgi:tricorn protease-like protein
VGDFRIEGRGLDIFTEELASLQRYFPRAARQLMSKSGSKARVIVARKARQLVPKVTGSYLKSIKRGKVFVDKATGGYKVRVYTGSRHGHLVEYGHRIVGADDTEHGFAEGYHVFEKAGKEIEDEWDEIIEKEFDRIMSTL